MEAHLSSSKLIVSCGVHVKVYLDRETLRSNRSAVLRQRRLALVVVLKTVIIIAQR